MKRILLVLALFTGLNFGLPDIAIAAGGGSSCFSLGIPVVSSSSDEIVVTVSIRSSCERPFGLSGGGPVYTISEESILTSSCEGPYDLSLFTSGTITCRIKIGGSLGSSRSGANSSTLKVWFAYDSGTKTTTFSHPQIPSKSSGSGSSGSSSGSTSNGSVAPKSCTKAPEVPVLKVSWNQTGPLFEFEPAASGDRATVLDWNYVLYDSQSYSWGTWSKWNEIYPAGAGSYQAQEIPGKTKIAFTVYATNACGSSGQAREVSSNTGVPLAPLVIDELTLILGDSTRVEVGQMLDIYGIVKSKLLLPLTAKSIAPIYCEVASNGQVKMLSSGDCQLQVSSTSFQEKAGSPAVIFKVIVKPNRANQIIPNLNINQSYDISNSPVTLELLTDAKLRVEFSAITDETCFVAGSSLILRTRGLCQINATQDGDENTLPAESRIFDILITQLKSTITCTKGKATKKMTGFNPKCPAGFKVKK